MPAPKSPRRAAAPKKPGAAKPPAAPKRKRTPAAKKVARPNPLAPAGAVGASAVNGTIAALPPALREHYTDQDIALILQRCDQDAPLSAIARLLNAGKNLRLDPLEGDIYLARGAARNGGEVEWSVVTRRDALLKYAERQERFRGHDEDEVHANDEFARVAPVGDGKTLRERAGVLHTYGKPAERGPVIGAWCAVETANPDGTLRPPTYFYATLEEYQPAKDTLGPEDPWRVHEGACIIKAAQLWSLRNGLGLTDIIGQEELDRSRRHLHDAVATMEDGTTTAMDWKTTADLFPDTEEGRELAAAVARLRELQVPGWPDAKLRGHLIGLDPDTEDGAAFLRQITGSVRAACASAEPDTAASPDGDPQAEGDKLIHDDKDAAATQEEVDRLIARRDELEARGDDVDGEEAAAMVEELEALELQIARLTGRPIATDLDDPVDNATALAEAVEAHRKIRSEYGSIRAERRLALDGGQTTRAAELERVLTKMAPDVMAAANKVEDLGGDGYGPA